MTSPRTIQVGQATATVVNIGEARGDLAEWLKMPEADRPAAYANLFKQPLRVPIQCIHIALLEASLLVDAGLYDFADHPSMGLPGYQPPPGLTAQLAEVGVQPDAITHVVITHAHLDHYNGLTHRQAGRLQPVFANARHYLGRADWERAETQKALQQPDSPVSQTLGVIQAHGLLSLVEGDLDLGHGLKIIAAPGETPGHQLVRVESAGQSLYCIGDLYHHPIEFEDPAWAVHWADVESNRASRLAFIEAAAAEEALMIATHIAATYRLRRTGSEVEWMVV
jgi:glyoxylase-like metal-dependent hydrolase (beta-lactamase superfamily II)